MSALNGRRDVQECRIVREDGTALDLEVTATPLAAQGRHFMAFSARDISHEKRRHALERVFFHDILNTASGVVGFAELLSTASSDESGEYIGHLYQLANRLIDEIRSQKALLDAENDSLEIVVLPISSVELLMQVAHEYAHPDLAMGRLIELDPEAEAVDMLTSPVLVRRVLANMARNALEASQRGDVVTLGCRAATDGVEFFVHNSGVMPQDVQLQVFQRSFSTKGAGRGLGTYSIRLLSERYLDGRVSFHSTPEAGTTFYAWYPLVLAEKSSLQG
jgi:signal transduction histidine kinase